MATSAAEPGSAFSSIGRSLLPRNDLWSDLATENYPEDGQTAVSNSSVPNYWPDFGALQYFELMYIISLIVLGTIGNLIVIFSIVVEGKVHSSGNIFIINLAVADFLVCSIALPSVAANILAKENALNEFFCDVVGYIVTATCACSLCNLALVAFNRYWAVLRHTSYKRIFNRKIGYSMVALAWVWSILVVCPTVLGWGELTFDAKALVCAWLDAASLSYAIFLIGCTVIVPLGVITFSYFRIFSRVRSSRKWKEGLGARPAAVDKHCSVSRRDRNLIQTLFATVIAFCVCWTPYAIHVFIDPKNTAAHVKKFLVWLALSNSSVNFIIYGTLNPAFKRRYKKLFYYVFRCTKHENSVGVTRTGCSTDHTGDRSALQNQPIQKQVARASQRPVSESQFFNGPEVTETAGGFVEMKSLKSTRPVQTDRRVNLRARLKKFFLGKS